ncbi:winged helix-turn-helix transcriptional regulator [Ramlibacter terrae]|uniref:Winged helix-turn-helix transcriptional regulator n=1 Tax=Ramlibacter terrae TaxID=2732511 RepID=A0ABX6P6Q8_9BURK|nr:winged helix-turn-helix transcriptional regulator [Ramlibacter terrae]
MKKRPASPAPSRKRAEPPPPEDGHEAAARVLRQFRVVFNAVKTHFRAVEKKAGPAGAQVWALSVVSSHPRIGVGELARSMDIHQSTASNLLKPLLEQGLVAAERSGVDRRAVHLHVTPAGARVLRKAPGPFTGVLPEALASLDAATLARLDRDLARVIGALGADAKKGNVPLGQPE